MKMRRHADYYPTPPCAAIALRDWLGSRSAAQYPWLDPAAGYGGLLESLVPDKAQRFAIELQPRFKPELQSRCADVRIGDGLDLCWEEPMMLAPNIVANPPFQTDLLEAFHKKMADWAHVNLRWSCLLTRTGYWQAKRRNSLPRPDCLLMLTWRPSFDGSGKTDMYSYCWACWRPSRWAFGDPTIHWLEKPAVPNGLEAIHRELAKDVL